MNIYLNVSNACLLAKIASNGSSFLLQYLFLSKQIHDVLLTNIKGLLYKTYIQGQGSRKPVGFKCLSPSCYFWFSMSKPAKAVKEFAKDPPAYIFISVYMYVATQWRKHITTIHMSHASVSFYNWQLPSNGGAITYKFCIQCANIVAVIELPRKSNWTQLNVKKYHPSRPVSWRLPFRQVWWHQVIVRLAPRSHDL